MFKNLKFKIKNFQSGITLVEVIVMIFIIALFAVILVSDFPRIQREFALSRVSYKLAQDLRRTQDMSLAGLKVENSLGDTISNIKGYGIYVSVASQPAEQYLIYADIATTDNPNGSQSFDNVGAKSCDQYDPVEDTGDCIVETIDVSLENPHLYIKSLNNIYSDITSINFSPPNPKVDIENRVPSQIQVGVTIGLETDYYSERTVEVNTSGLINVQ